MVLIEGVDNGDGKKWMDAELYLQEERRRCAD